MTRLSTPPLLAWGGIGRTAIPFADVTPEALEQTVRGAIGAWHGAMAAIIADPAPPTFANTILPWEEAALWLDRARQLLGIHAAMMSTPDYAALEAALAPELSRAEDQALLDPALFARVDSVHRAGVAEAEDARLTALLRERLIRHGARLDEAGRTRLAVINAELAATVATFNRNTTTEEREQITLVTDAAELEGLSDAARAAAARLAAERGHDGAWAIANQRPVVMDVLATARDRTLRERVWRRWNTRCDEPGPHDNRPVLAKLVALRTEKARLLGFADYADFALSNRMARSPETAMHLLEEVAANVLPVTRRQLDEAQEIAREDGLNGPIEAWDRYFYEEAVRRRRFGVDAAALRPYMPVSGVIAAALDAAARLHDISFVPAPEADRYHPDVIAYHVERGGQRIGLLYFDVIARPEKRNGSWMQPVQAASRLDGGTRPVAIVTTSVPAGSGDEPAQMGWTHAVAVFHEVGHALHLLLARTRYPSTGILAVPWDFIELPALINERWLEDRALINRHFRHWRTGEPIAESLVEGVLAAARHDRVFSMTLGFLAGAIIDLELYRASGEDRDAGEIEREVLARLEMPGAIDQIMRPAHFFHIASDAYAAGVYSYLWSDVMAADVADAFLKAPGGLYDAATAARWRDILLTSGALEPADEAFRRFRGRDQRPDALLERFGIAA